MSKIRIRTLAVVTGVTLATAALLQAFLTLLFERTSEHLVQDLVFGIPLLVLILGAVLVALHRFLGPLDGWRPGSDTSPDDRARLQGILTRVPQWLWQSNLVLFFLLPLVVLGGKLLFGHPVPGILDLFLNIALNGAFGFLAALQEIALFESITIPLRTSLGATRLEGHVKDISLSRRLFLVNLASVCVSALLAGMAALGFYREVVAYYTSLGADALSGASAGSSESISENELKVMVQLGALFLAVLAWTQFLTATALSTLSRRLKALDQKVREMADGRADLGRRAPVVFFDEVGQLTEAINSLMDHMHGVVAAIQATSAHVLDSTNRVRSISLETEGRLARVDEAKVAAFQALGGQAEALGATIEVAQSLELTAAEVRSGVANQAQSVALGAAAMDQMAGSVNAVRDLTLQADQLATSLRQTSDQGGKSVDAVRLSMESIQAAAQAVAGTVATIKKTASQTNLLAMNAAIEAAHAGQSGQGFAVVAGEVRSLAEDSSRAAKKIADLMRDMTVKIADGDRLARGAGEAFSKIFELIVQTSELMSTVARAMDEQKAGTETILAATHALREASSRIGQVTEKQSEFAGQINGSVMKLLEAGAVMAMAQDVQGRATAELSELVHTISKETEENLRVADELGQTVAGFTLR